jgi:hypothetical protein
MSKGKSGQGPQSNPPVRYGQPARGVNPGATSYIGTKRGNHATEDGSGHASYTPHYGNPPTNAAQPLGNEVASNVGRGGPGVGRLVHGCGSQGTHGAPNRGNPADPGADIWSQFPNPGGRR